ncbi:hypothetical protein Taro_014207 [Colocasia esculenta]|uniref:Uncharacterized protein n=1 Tax=Colocasia esculenta TaxID=4460 RepID=A0A843UHK9_COLES|nr:hypothetical protein [Colocasia esculenta]
MLWESMEGFGIRSCSVSYSVGNWIRRGCFSYTFIEATWKVAVLQQELAVAAWGLPSQPERRENDVREDGGWVWGCMVGGIYKP